jgi:hypothetical protein
MVTSFVLATRFTCWCRTISEVIVAQLTAILVLPQIEQVGGNPGNIYLVVY